MAMELDQVFVIDESPEEAWGSAQAKMDAARSTGDERSRALCLIKVAEALVLMGQPNEAYGPLYEAQAVCNDMKFEEGRAACMNVAAKVSAKKASDEEELEEAMDSATDALKLFKKCGFRKGEAAALVTLSGVCAAMKKATPAVKHAKEALAVFAELGEKRAMAETYDAVKNAYLIKKPAETFLASKQMQKATELYGELGDKSKQAACMHSAAVIEKADLKKAAELLQKAKELFEEAGDFKGQGMVLETVMGVLVENDQFEQAVKVGKDRAAIFRNAGDAGEEARAMLKLGDVLMQSGAYARAEKAGEVAISLFASVNDMDGLKASKDLVDGAKHARVAEDIEASISKCSSAMHVPKSLIVNPGLNKRVAGTFAMAIA